MTKTTDKIAMLDTNEVCFSCGRKITKVFRFKGVAYGSRCINKIVKAAGLPAVKPTALDRVTDLANLITDGWDAGSRHTRDSFGRKGFEITARKGDTCRVVLAARKAGDTSKLSTYLNAAIALAKAE